jgi:predicted ATPase
LGSLGYPDQALKRSHEALTQAQELAHSLSLALALNIAAVLHQFRREGQAVQEQAEALLTLATEQRFPIYLAEGTMLRGWALTEQGQVEEGITQMQQGLAAFRATGAELERPYWLVLLAEAHEKIEHAEEGLTLLSEALAVVEKSGVRFYEAELYRLRGELTLQGANQKAKVKAQKSKVPDPQSQLPDPNSEAEACFLKAIEIAQRQQAKSLELRATVSLVRLRKQQAAQSESRNTNHASRAALAEAHTMLSEIYNWFTEGFDTKDLQEAKALLNSLESRV